MNKKDLIIISSVFLISKIILVLFLVINNNLAVVNPFDAELYIEIATNGYTSNYLMAFFPLYPLLIRFVSFFISNSYISGMIISNICCYISLIILNNILNNNKNKLYYFVLFSFSPILAFTSICYTESLFMMLTLLGYYLYKKDMHILSAIVIGLSILTRNSGIILWGAIGLDMLYRLFKKKNIKFKSIIIFGIISLAIGLTYPIYLYFKTGNFLEFVTVQTTYWFREKGFFINGINKDLIILSNNHNIVLWYIFLQNWLSFFCLLLFGIKLFKKDMISSIYIIISLLAFQSMFRNIEVYPYNLASISLFRYTYNLFPIYLYVLDNKKNIIKYIIIFIFFITSILNALLLYYGNFIA